MIDFGHSVDEIDIGGKGVGLETKRKTREVQTLEKKTSKAQVKEKKEIKKKKKKLMTFINVARITREIV